TQGPRRIERGFLLPRSPANGGAVMSDESIGFAPSLPAATSSSGRRRQISDRVRAEVRGIWLPLVTPFKDGALDEVSLKRLLRHISARPVDGLVVAATTGEGPLLEEREIERLAG